MRRIRGRRTDYEQVEYIPPDYSVELKGTVSVILSDPPCKDDDSRFTNMEDKIVFLT